MSTDNRDIEFHAVEIIAELDAEIERLRAELDASGCDYCSIPEG